MRYFDFSDETIRALDQAKDDVSRWSVRTTVGREMFPGACLAAGFTLLRPGQLFSPDVAEQTLVIGVASWSDPDLIVLENLAKQPRGGVEVVLFDVDHWQFPEILNAFPGAFAFRSTPYVIQYRFGVVGFSGQGNSAVQWLDQF